MHTLPASQTHSLFASPRLHESRMAAQYHRRCNVICGARDRQRGQQVTTVTIQPNELLCVDNAKAQASPCLVFCVWRAQHNHKPYLSTILSGFVFACFVQDKPLTVYSCRFSTGHGRGAALSDPMSYINLCLIGAWGWGAASLCSIPRRLMAYWCLCRAFLLLRLGYAPVMSYWSATTS